MTVQKVKGGYKVKAPNGHAFSKHPQSKEKAEAQLRAIEAHKHGDKKFSRRTMTRRPDGSYGEE